MRGKNRKRQNKREVLIQKRDGLFELTSKTLRDEFSAGT